MPASRMPRSFSFPSAPRRFFETVSGRRTASHSKSASHAAFSPASGPSELAYLTPDLGVGGLRPSIEAAFDWLDGEDELGKGSLRRRLPNVLKRKGSRAKLARPSTAPTASPPTRRLSLSPNLTSPPSPSRPSHRRLSKSPSPLCVDFGPSMLTALDVLADPAAYDDHHRGFDGADFFSSTLAFTYPSPPPSFVSHRRSRSLGLPPTALAAPVSRVGAPAVETVLEEDEDRLSSRAASTRSSPQLSSSSTFPSPDPSASEMSASSTLASLSASLTSFDDFIHQLHRDFPPSSASSSSSSGASSSSSSPQLGHSSFSFAAGASAESLVDPKLLLLPPLKPRKSTTFDRFGYLPAAGPPPTWALPPLPTAGAKAAPHAPAFEAAEDEGDEWEGTQEGEEGYWDALEEFEGM